MSGVKRRGTEEEEELDVPRKRSRRLRNVKEELHDVTFHMFCLVIFS